MLHSELYLIDLLADCCAAHWEHTSSPSRGPGNGADRVSYLPGSVTGDQPANISRTYAKHLGPHDVWEPRYTRQYGASVPQPLDNGLVGRILDALKHFVRPVLEPYILPTSTILDDGASLSAQIDTSTFPDNTKPGSSHLTSEGALKLLDEKSEEIELSVRSIIEFISASNWVHVLEHLKTALRGLRSAYPLQGAAGQNNIVTEDDIVSLVTLRLVDCFWVDARKLTMLMQEFCGSFLHLRKPFQYTVLVVLPLLITRWLHRYPEEFVKLHIEQRRLDGTVDTLFEMTNTMVEAGRWRQVLHPFQNALLLLLPDVFQVASHMRDARSNSMVKKVAFLEGLRKALRNRNPTAAYCLLSLLRAARHFSFDGDSALLSYALDVQDDVREVLFRRFSSDSDAANFDDNLMTSAFVTLAQLNFDMCQQSLTPLCLSPGSLMELKITYISACCYFARQPDVQKYQPLFKSASGLTRLHLEVTTLLDV